MGMVSLNCMQGPQGSTDLCALVLCKCFLWGNCDLKNSQRLPHGEQSCDRIWNVFPPGWKNFRILEAWSDSSHYLNTQTIIKVTRWHFIQRLGDSPWRASFCLRYSPKSCPCLTLAAWAFPIIHWPLLQTVSSILPGWLSTTFIRPYDFICQRNPARPFH